MIVFLNGQFVSEQAAMVPVTDRGLLYGDGLFETLRVFQGKPFRMAQHLERLSRGAEYIGIKCPYPPKQLQRFAEELIEKNQLPDSVLRLTLTRGSGERGYAPIGTDAPTVLMTLHPAPPVDAQVTPQCALITSSFRVPAADALSSFKTTNKLTQVMAQAEARTKGADEALLLNSNGEVAEAAAANFFWIYRDKVCTIPTGRGVLPGITRAVVLEICQTMNLVTNKRVIKPTALAECDALFLTQSVQGIVAVTSFDGEPVAQSPLVDQLHQAYCELLAKE